MKGGRVGKIWQSYTSILLQSARAPIVQVRVRCRPLLSTSLSTTLAPSASSQIVSKELQGIRVDSTWQVTLTSSQQGASHSMPFLFLPFLAPLVLLPSNNPCVLTTTPNKLEGQAARLANGDGATRRARLRAHSLHRFHHLCALKHFTKDHMLAV